MTVSLCPEAPRSEYGTVIPRSDVGSRGSDTPAFCANKMNVWACSICPEQVFGGDGYGAEIDVFSLGVLIWDAYARGTADNPLCGLAGDACRAKMEKGLRPPLVSNSITFTIPDEVRNLIERCWTFERADRPRADEVATELRSFAAADVVHPPASLAPQE